MLWVLLIFCGFWLAYSNGANDNFKGVATLFGSNTLGFRRALILATLATFAGSVASLFLARTLVKSFSGNGFIPDEFVGSVPVFVAVSAAAAGTILLATYLGMPTSTTHALTGGLLGVGLVIGGSHVQWLKLWSSFLLPLLISPILAIGATIILYPLLHRLRMWMGISRESCVCVVDGVPEAAGCLNSDALPLCTAAPPRIEVGSIKHCSEKYHGHCAGLSAQMVVDGLHYLSGASVCFARALNDTPKIAALFLIGGAHVWGWPVALLVIAMALGGILNSRKVALTMSRRITDLNPGQGLTANLVTAGLVLGASHAGVPVSTTHVSCGAIFGIGLAQRQGRWKTIAQICGAWLTTLPLSTVLGVLFFALIRGMSS